METQLQLREITYLDNSKKRILILYNATANLGHIKITVKQYKALIKLGVQALKINSEN